VPEGICCGNILNNTIKGRPVCILCVFAKIFIEGNGLLQEFKSGFRCGHCTISTVVKVTNDLKCCESGFDFSKAFGCIPHDLFVDKLRFSYGFSSSAARLMVSDLRLVWCTLRLDFIPILSCLQDSKFHFNPDDL
jgi:hypothetical protein